MGIARRLSNRLSRLLVRRLDENVDVDVILLAGTATSGFLRAGGANGFIKKAG